MTSDREIMQQALDALEEAKEDVSHWGSYASEYFQNKHNLEGDEHKNDKLIEALRARLAQPEPEPVAWVKFKDGEITHAELTDGSGVDMDLTGWTPLYTAPPQREWQGLTDEEVREAYCAVSDKEWAIGGMSDAEPFARAIESRLKEKNT